MFITNRRKYFDEIISEAKMCGFKISPAHYPNTSAGEKEILFSGHGQIGDENGMLIEPKGDWQKIQWFEFCEWVLIQMPFELLP
jgi:hypothetical protein